jgi:putative cell wall-binding protein
MPRSTTIGALAALVMVTLAPAASASESDVIVPVGPEGVTYRYPAGPDDGNVEGPPAFGVTSDGTTWIVDLYADRLLRYARDGAALAPVDLTPLGVLAAIDLAAGRDAAGRDVVAVLDVHPKFGRYRVLRLAGNGRLLSTHEIPDSYRLEEGLSGVALDGDGSLLVEIEGGNRLLEIADATGAPRRIDRTHYTWHGRPYRVRWEAGRAFVQAGSLTIEVAGDHMTGGVQFIGAEATGEFLVAVEDVHAGEHISVDVTVRRYSPRGRVLSVARRDVRAQTTYVPHPFAAAADGTLRELTTADDHVRVAPMAFAGVLAPVLPLSPVRRWPAVDTIDTALQMSRRAFPDGARVALLGRSDDFADALASGAAQGAWKAPLLLTPGDALDPDVAIELARLDVGTVHLLGGPAALSDNVAQDLADLGISTTRTAGRDRVETAVALARKVAAEAPTVVLARGYGTSEPTAAFADALAVAPWSAERGWPTLLTTTNRLPAVVADQLRTAGTHTVHVVGGPAAVSDAVVAELRRLGMTVHRVAGPDRSATAAAVADHRPNGDSVLLVDGNAATAWASGTTSAAWAAQSAATVLLTRGDTLPAATAQWLRAHAGASLVCGPTVTAAACRTAAAALGQ